MKYLLKRYIYGNGLDIVAPLKCGTRWLEGLDTENRLNLSEGNGFHMDNMDGNIHSGTTFIWRPVREHIKSAIQTELAMRKPLIDLITELEEDMCDHWSPYLYQKIYPLWERLRFRFWKLRNISSLSKEAESMDYNSHRYDFKLPKVYTDVDSAINSLSPKHKIRLERMISEEEKYLKLMIEPQYSGKSWEEYSNLEDELFDCKCKLATTISETSRLHRLEINKELESKLRESEKSYLVLKSKISEYEKRSGQRVLNII
jgi:hypothetical protein